MDQISIDSIDASVDLPKTESRRPQSSPEIVEGSPLVGRDPFTSSHRRRAPQSNVEARLSELEEENLRLHRLVAELLIKNQQLRRCH